MFLARIHVSFTWLTSECATYRHLINSVLLEVYCANSIKIADKRILHSVSCVNGTIGTAVSEECLRQSDCSVLIVQLIVRLVMLDQKIVKTRNRMDNCVTVLD